MIYNSFQQNYFARKVQSLEKEKSAAEFKRLVYVATTRAINHAYKTDVKGRDVLIVEDIVDTGHTLKFMEELLLQRGAKSVKCCALLNKPARREEDVKVDYYGAEVQNQFVVGYGLDYLNKYRNIPYIGVLKPEVIKANLNK